MIVISFLAILSVLTLAFVSWRRSGCRWRIGVVECLRVALVVFAVALLWQPVSIYPVESNQTRSVVVLVDGSTSMRTPDVVSAGTKNSRGETAARVVDDAGWQKLDPRLERRVIRFAVEDPGTSDLAEAIDRAFADRDDVAAVVLVSDGDWNRGRSPVEAADDAVRQSGGTKSVFGIALGSAERLPDLELVSADVPSYGVSEKPVRIPYVVRNWFSGPREVSVELRIDGANTETQTVSIPPGGRIDGAFTWRTERPGRAQIEIVVPEVAGESDPQNNSRSRAIEIRPERLRVLIVESVPRWEYRFLRNALLRDPGIEVSSLLFHPELDVVGGGGKDAISELPKDAADWAQYDVIFLGDVGIAPGQLTVDQTNRIRGMVEQQAAGLVLMPGQRGGQATLPQTELGDLYPVILDDRRVKGIGSGVESSFSLTQSGRSSLLTELADDAQSNWEVWNSLPGFFWHAAVVRSKAGSDVLAVHAESSNRYGRLPLLVTRPAGAGKVLFIGTDAAWRWRLGVEDKYHYRFWGQVIRWMAYQRNMAVGERMRLSFRPERPSVGQPVSIRASVMTGQGAPLQADGLRIDVTREGNDQDPIALERTDAEWGVFVGETRFDLSGAYTLTLNHPGEDSTISVAVEVQGGTSESVGPPARPDIMREIARVGGGLAVDADNVAAIVRRLNRQVEQRTEVRRIEWWNRPAVLFGMIAGLTVFWIGRKWAGAL